MTDDRYKTLTLVWRSIPIEVRFAENWSKAASQHYGEPLSHLQIRAEGSKRLPITETGYKSHFILASRIQAYGGVERYVSDWLDDASQSTAWKNHIAASNQLKLF